jgi:hypothetical protein
MNDSENNFRDVKRLLKLKQHEVPPPGYFNNFSSQVVSRIRAGEAREARSVSGNLKERASWLAKFLGLFEAQPRLVGGVATVACVLLVFGLVLTQQSDSDTTPGTFLSANSQSDQTFAAGAPVASSAGSLADPLASSGIAVSTNPVTSLQPMAAAFGQPGTVSLFQPAGFSTPGH